ncbi:MAG TPA: tetratricopeptide repeat protein, partial [Pirellulales bacterium]|nr:tetratricopeptide repeat protein [Pirellulales bacterium]
MQNSPRVRAILALAALVAAHPRVTVAWDETEDSAPADAPWKQVLNDDDAKQVAALTARMKDAVKYADAIPWAEQIAEIRARVQGADHWEAADARRRVVTLKDIAAMPAQAQAELAGVRKIAAGASHLESLDQFSEAEPLHRQALAIVTRLLAMGHPLVAENQDSLAMNLSRQSKYADAQSLFELSLEIRRRALGEDHPDTANAYNSLAFNLYYQGKFAAAKLRLEKALQIRRAVLGEDDPVTAMTYNNLAAILNGQGKYAEAEPMSRKVLAIYRRAF